MSDRYNAFCMGPLADLEVDREYCSPLSSQADKIAHQYLFPTIEWYFYRNELSRNDTFLTVLYHSLFWRTTTIKKKGHHMFVKEI